MSFRSWFCLCALASLFGCAATPHVEREWPASLPPLAHFRSVYAEDPANRRVQSEDEYLTWVIRFYQGWELADRGWHHMTELVVDNVDDPAERAWLIETLGRLGRRISAEWAKESKQRVIFTPTLITWSNALLESIEREEVVELARKVNADVDALFARRISSDAIRPGRYYPRDDPFF